MPRRSTPNRLSTEGPPRVTVLCGGFGAARFLSGLRQNEAETTCVVNTADDLEYAGLHISPDVDTVAYALAGRYDEERGWGLVATPSPTPRPCAASAPAGSRWATRTWPPICAAPVCWPAGRR